MKLAEYTIWIVVDEEEDTDFIDDISDKLKETFGDKLYDHEFVDTHHT